MGWSNYWRMFTSFRTLGGYLFAFTRNIMFQHLYDINAQLFNAAISTPSAPANYSHNDPLPSTMPEPKYFDELSLDDQASFILRLRPQPMPLTHRLVMELTALHTRFQAICTSLNIHHPSSHMSKSISRPSCTLRIMSYVISSRFLGFDTGQVRGINRAVIDNMTLRLSLFPLISSRQAVDGGG